MFSFVHSFFLLLSPVGIHSISTSPFFHSLYRYCLRHWVMLSFKVSLSCTHTFTHTPTHTHTHFHTHTHTHIYTHTHTHLHTHTYAYALSHNTHFTQTQSSGIVQFSVKSFRQPRARSAGARQE